MQILHDRSVDEYLNLVVLARSRFEPIPAPNTLEELRELNARYPHLARPFLPAREERERLGFFIDIEPFGERFRHRLLATLADDPEFRQAMANRLGVH